MGLDVRLVRVRKKHVDSDSRIEELYEKGTYVSEYRNTYDLLTILNLSEDEKDNAVCYRMVNDLPICGLCDYGTETLRFLETYESLDRDKFVYLKKNVLYL